MKFVKAENMNDLEKYFPLMNILRPHLNLEKFLELYKAAHAADSYEIVAAIENDEIVALMGYRVLHDFVHGRHLYIDDLISSPDNRSKGVGAKLLAHVDEIAKDLGCSNLRLCTGIDNNLAKKFYEREGWQFRSVVFKKKI